MLYAVKNTESQDESATANSLLTCFATGRRSPEDVYWLKENSELLRVLTCTESPVSVASLACYERFYQEAPLRLQFFPQYYRFILSICRDLELLGFSGDTYSSLNQFVLNQRFVAGELSDLQRLETHWLTSPFNSASEPDAALLDRVRNFCVNAPYFAVPNRKAAFELTHAVFYISGYGMNNPAWLADLKTSLEYAGMVALLDDDVDLLAEVLVALRYCGVEPPFYWQHVARAAHGSVVATESGTNMPGNDFYHEALTLGWAESLAGGALLANGFTASDAVFSRGSRLRQPTPLRELSGILWRSAERRTGDWGAFSRDAGDALSDVARTHIHALSASCPKFDEFFHHFSRSVAVPR